MSGSTLRSRRGVRGLGGPEEDANRLELLNEELIAINPIAAAALAEGAISEEEYRAVLARADEIETRASSDPRILEEARALRAELEATRASGLTAHRRRVWLMVLVAVLLGVLLVGGLAAWSYRSKR